MKQVIPTLGVLFCAISLVACGKRNSGKMMLLCTAVENPEDDVYPEKFSTMRFDSGAKPIESSTQGPLTYTVSLEPTTEAKSTSKTTIVESVTKKATKTFPTASTSTTLKRPAKVSTQSIIPTTGSSLTSTKKKRKKNKTIRTCPQGYVKDKRGVCRLTLITESPSKN